jgi:glycosyltransferase involved in cell wall biosynthesis
MRNGDAERVASHSASSLKGRLGIYIDAVHGHAPAADGPRIAIDPADYAFIGVFLPEVGRHFDSLLLFGRMLEEPAPEYFAPLPEGVELVELPHYPALTHLLAVSRAAASTINVFRRSLDRVDTVWIFGPHPFSVALIGLAMLPVRALDAVYRLCARGMPAVVTGSQIARRYGGEGRRVLAMIESVVRSDEVAQGPRDRDWRGPIELLTVGRLDAEKNPLLLVDAFARLASRDDRGWKLTWVGGGPMEEAIRTRAAELGVEASIELVGWVPFGPALLELYGRAHAFVHVSFTEGVPKVLVEALASAMPIVATDVGGVSELLDGGLAGLLVAPNDLDGLVEAVERIANDPALRHEIVSHGLRRVRELTLEAQAEQVASFIAGAVSGG